MEWGENAEWLAKIAAEREIAPQALLDRPDIPEHLASVYNAFWTLSGDRRVTISTVVTGDGGILQRADLGPIYFQAIDAYARRFGLDDRDRFERFEHLIRCMDAAYRQWVAEQSKEG